MFCRRPAFAAAASLQEPVNVALSQVALDAAWEVMKSGGAERGAEKEAGLSRGDSCAADCDSARKQHGSCLIRSP